MVILMRCFSQLSIYNENMPKYHIDKEEWYPYYILSVPDKYSGDFAVEMDEEQAAVLFKMQQQVSELQETLYQLTNANK